MSDAKRTAVREIKWLANSLKGMLELADELQDVADLEKDARAAQDQLEACKDEVAKAQADAAKEIAAAQAEVAKAKQDGAAALAKVDADGKEAIAKMAASVNEAMAKTKADYNIKANGMLGDLEGLRKQNDVLVAQIKSANAVVKDLNAQAEALEQRKAATVAEIDKLRAKLG